MVFSGAQVRVSFRRCVCCSLLIVMLNDGVFLVLCIIMHWRIGLMDHIPDPLNKFINVSIICGVSHAGYRQLLSTDL